MAVILCVAHICGNIFHISPANILHAMYGQFMGIFVSGTYLATTHEDDVVLVCVLAYRYKNIGSMWPYSIMAMDSYLHCTVIFFQ